MPSLTVLLRLETQPNSHGSTPMKSGRKIGRFGDIWEDLMWEGLTAPQCRAGRALLGWSRKDLANHSKLSLKSIQRLEEFDGRPVASYHILSTVNGAFLEAGISLLDNGVRIPREPEPPYHDLDMLYRMARRLTQLVPFDAEGWQNARLAFVQVILAYAEGLQNNDPDPMDRVRRLVANAEEIDDC